MRTELRKDNRGIALISVMICATLCLLLSATILRVSLLSYRQKAIGKQSTSTFYENEVYFDDIKMGLQAKVAAAYAATSTASRASFASNFKTALLADGGTALEEKEKIENALTSYLTGYNPSSTIKDVRVTVEGYNNGSTTTYIDDSVEGEIVIKNVRISYTDLAKGGYISEIRTDIRIRSPYYTISPGDPGSTSNYSMVAGGGSTIKTADGQDTVLHVAGSYYSGYQVSNYANQGGSTNVETAAEIANGTVLYFTESPSEKTARLAAKAAHEADPSQPLKEPNSVVFNGDVYIKDTSRLVFLGGNVIVRGTIYIEENAKLIVSEKTTLTCRDIVLRSNKSNKVSVASGSYTGSNTVDHLPYPKKRYDETTGQGYDGAETGYNNKGSFFICKSADSSVSDMRDTFEFTFKYNNNQPSQGIEKLKTGSLKANVVEVSFGDGSVTGYSNIRLTSGSRSDLVATTNVVLNDGPFSDGKYYDHEYCSIVDVEYLLQGLKTSNYVSNTTKKISNTTGLTANSAGKFDTTISNNQTSGGDGGENPHNIEGVTSCCIVGSNSALTTLNGRNSWFILTMDKIKFNDMNNNINSGVVLFSPKVVELPAKDGNYVCLYALRDVVTKDTYKKYIDAIGYRITAKDLSSYGKYSIVNNYFIDGIKTLYAEPNSSNQQQSSGETKEVTDADRILNGTLEIVSFENWEKNPDPVVTPTS